MQFFLSKLVRVVLLLSLCVAFTTPTAYAQTTGRSVSPPTFPQCSSKLIINGDKKHEEDGSHKVIGRDDIDGSRDLYSLTDGNFVECTCPKDSDTGVQTNWWYISGLPLGKVDIDAYTRDGWNSANGSEWDLLDGNYLAKTEEVSCKVSAQSSTKTPTSTRKVTNTPTPRTSITKGDVSPTPTDNSDETLPETGLPFGFVVGIAVLGGAGLYIRKYFFIQ